MSDARLRPEWASLSADDEAHTAWKAPELLLATFDTSALLIDASGGGVASTATSAFALPVTERTDVYAFGMTCYEVALRMLPFEGKPAEAVAWLVARKKERPHVPILVERREGAAPILALMRRCWVQEAVARPTFAQLVPELEAMYAEHEEQGEASEEPTRSLQHQP